MNNISMSRISPKINITYIKLRCDKYGNFDINGKYLIRSDIIPVLKVFNNLTVNYTYEEIKKECDKVGCLDIKFVEEHFFVINDICYEQQLKNENRQIRKRKLKKLNVK